MWKEMAQSGIGSVFTIDQSKPKRNQHEPLTTKNVCIGLPSIESTRKTSRVKRKRQVHKN